jgi:uncharacterized lipoprotein YddW (UPF0748 family)
MIRLLLFGFLLWGLLHTVCGQSSAILSMTITRRMGLEGRVIWVDGSANLKWLIDRDQIRSFVSKCRDSGINLIVLDIKPISGYALYHSNIAPRTTEWRGIKVPSEMDILQVFLDEAHEAGLQVHAAINTLSEGHKYFNRGPAYEHPEWQMIAFGSKRTLVLPNGSRFDLDRFDRPPPPNGIAAYLRAAAPIPPPDRSYAYAMLSEDMRVSSVVDGQFVTEPVRSENGNWVLVADGDAALSFEKLTSLGIGLKLESLPALQRIADSDTEGVAVFVNPLHPEVRSRLLGIVREICENYPIDGFVLDRGRWANVYTDFSDRTRSAFESKYGRVANFPQDILRVPDLPRQPFQQGSRFAQWVQFRAEVIRDLVLEIRQTIDSVRPMPLGAYVGSWYPVYYELGVNWGSDTLEKPYSFVDGTYRFTSYLDNMDYLMPGCYYNVPFMADAAYYDTDEVRTVEGMTKRCMDWTAGGTFVYSGIYTDDYKNDPSGFERAIRAARMNSHGVMIFDASQIVEWDWWETIRRGLGIQDSSKANAQAPHELPSLLPSLRKAGNGE